MENRVSFADDQYNELVITNDLNQAFVISRQRMAGVPGVADYLRKNPHDALSIEIHPNGYGGEGNLIINISFDEAVDIMKHIMVLYKEHEDAGDFDE